MHLANFLPSSWALVVVALGDAPAPPLQPASAAARTTELSAINVFVMGTRVVTGALPHREHGR
jgi:hypothetical protein